MSKSLAELGAIAKADIATYRERGLALRLNEPLARKFAHDIDIYTKLEELPDETVGRLMRAATASNLRALGYAGARSELGESIVPIFTAVLYKVRRVYGAPYIFQNGAFIRAGEPEKHEPHRQMRGVLNRTDIRKFFCDAMDQLLLELLSLPQKANND